MKKIFYLVTIITISVIGCVFEIKSTSEDIEMTGREAVRKPENKTFVSSRTVETY